MAIIDLNTDQLNQNFWGWTSPTVVFGSASNAQPAFPTIGCNMSIQTDQCCFSDSDVYLHVVGEVS